MKRESADPRWEWALFSVLCMGGFSLVNGGQRWLNSENLQLGSFGSFEWDILPLVAFALTARRALQCGEPPAAAASPSPAGHDPLLMLRALACLMVLGGHGVGFSFESPDYVHDLAANMPVWLLAPSPYCGVWIFFVLSGYLIGKGFNSGRYDVSRVSVARYLKNRCLRILPVFWLINVLIMVFAYTSILEPRNILVFLNVLAFNVDGRFAFIPIGALWSISTEFQFYILAPMLVILLRVRQASLVYCLILATVVVVLETGARLALVIGLGPLGWMKSFYMPLIGNLDLFLIGMITSRIVIICRARAARLSAGLSAGWIIMLALYVVMAWLYTRALYLSERLPLFIFAGFATSSAGIATALTIFCFEMAEFRGTATRLYRWCRPLEILGLLTYAIYSIHEPVFLFFKYHVRQPPTFLLSILLFCVVCTGLLVPALGIYHFVEQPFVRMKWRAHVNRQSPASSVSADPL